MSETKTVGLARVLRVLVLITFACNLLVLPLVPGAAVMAVADRNLVQELQTVGPGGLRYIPAFFLSSLLQLAWEETSSAVLTLFLWACGTCTAVILWQAKRVLGRISSREPFSPENARSVGRAAVCCLLISAAALARTVWSLAYYRSIGVLFTYNTLFIPVFLMAGVLCLVISALFRQAAEMKAENDLTI